MNEELTRKTKNYQKINIIEEIKMEMLRNDQKKLWMKQFQVNLNDEEVTEKTMTAMAQYIKVRLAGLQYMENKEQGLLEQLKNTQKQHDNLARMQQLQIRKRRPGSPVDSALAEAEPGLTPLHLEIEEIRHKTIQSSKSRLEQNWRKS